MVCNICEIWLAFIGIHLVISWKCRNLQAQVALCALISPMAAPFANLYGVAKAWFQNDVIKTRFEDGGIGSIVMTGKNQAVVTKDQQHAVWNSEVLIPIMQNMAANHLIKAPDMPTIEAQVHTLLLLHQKKGSMLMTYPQSKTSTKSLSTWWRLASRSWFVFAETSFSRCTSLGTEFGWKKVLHLFEMTRKPYCELNVCEKNVMPISIYDYVSPGVIHDILWYLIYYSAFRCDTWYIMISYSYSVQDRVVPSRPWRIQNWPSCCPTSVTWILFRISAVASTSIL